MTKAATESPVSTAAPVLEPPALRINVNQYHAMIEHAILTEDMRAELLNGRIVEKMPIGELHAACVFLISRYLERLLPGEILCRTENPVTLPDYSEPEPDIAVVTFRSDLYAKGHPTGEEIRTIIEVAASSIYVDRNIKAAIYAAAGVSELWIVNLNNFTLEVYRKPTPDGQYDYREVFGFTDTFSTREFGELNVAALFPEGTEP